MGIRILRNEDIDYMLSIVESNLPDKEKAKILYSFCNFKTINDTLERENVGRKNDLERLKKIYRIYDGNDYLPLSKKRYKCTVEDIELRVDKLAKAREIVLSSVKDYKKVEKLLILYKDLEDFRRQYSLFQRYGKEDKNLDLFRETLDSIDMVYSKLKEYEENGLIDNIKFINDNSQLINNYENAKKIINHYIDDPDSYNHENFFASLSIDKEKFGSIPDVTDKGYYTNSYHVDVREKIDAFHKLKFESEFQPLSGGGAISYVEVPNMKNNLQALEEVVKFIYDNIQYAEFNTKSDYCQVCGFDGEIIINDNNEWECPNCGNKDHSKMNVVRRTCGYLGENFWNAGKTKEIKQRVLHM